MTVAPLVANGVVIAGVAGAEFGHRGFSKDSMPRPASRSGAPIRSRRKGEPGSETWPKAIPGSTGGGSTWVTGCYDPDLDLVFWGTGNPAPWNPLRRKGDNLYTNSMLAIRPKTGEMRLVLPDDARGPVRLRRRQ